MTRAAGSKVTSSRTLLRHDWELGPGVRFRIWEHDGSWSASGRAAHPGIELAWLETGCAQYRVGSAEFAAGGGSVMIVPAEAEHLTQLDSAMRGVALWLDPALVSEIADATSTEAARRRIVPGLADPGAIPALVRLLEGEVSRQATAWRLAADALVETLVIELLRVAPGRQAYRSARDPRIAVALETIESRYGEALSLEDLARSAGMSRFHFSRLFREQMGEPPYQHLLRVRIAHAAELLRRRSRTVTEAALEVGFQDLGRFSRLFRAQIGCLPSDFARARSRQRWVGAAARGTGES